MISSRADGEDGITSPVRPSRRLVLGGLTAAAAGLVLPGSARATHRAKTGSIMLFGDSYSAVSYMGVTNWGEQLRAAGSVTVAGNFARATATASSRTARSFEAQLNSWAGNRRLADTTFVYFGYNDIYQKLSLDQSKADYVRGVDRLVQGGLASGTRRILLVLIHDWSRNPGAVGNERWKVKSWNQFVRSVADARRNVGVVDVFAEIERVLARPASYGLRNVTGYSATASTSTYLFYDLYHFGNRGQAIVASRMQAALAGLQVAEFDHNNRNSGAAPLWAAASTAGAVT